MDEMEEGAAMEKGGGGVGTLSGRVWYRDRSIGVEIR